MEVGDDNGGTYCGRVTSLQALLYKSSSSFSYSSNFKFYYTIHLQTFHSSKTASSTIQRLFELFIALTGGSTVKLLFKLFIVQTASSTILLLFKLFIALTAISTIKLFFKL